jgi:uncharacterized protein (DUF924 family)
MCQDVLAFWFDELEPQQWWLKDESIDHLIKRRFLSLYAKAKCCELFTWRETAEGRLAEIIVLDQFPRNMFRDKPEAFASDPLALALAQEAALSKADQRLKSIQRSFLYMPFMHSESLLIHEVAVDLFRKSGNESSFEFELKHKQIIERFGRYPHRNKVLGRESTAAEIDFLKQPGSGF